MGSLTIRPARIDDLPAINAIYNHFVLHSTCTYQTEPETPEGRAAWFANHGAKHPGTVGELDGKVVAWGSLSRFHARAAYGRTVENSVYVHPDQHRRGYGRALLVDLIERAGTLGHHAIIALIDADQAPSVRLHEAAGFVQVGLLKEVGFKFNRWLHVVYMELVL